MDKPIQKAIDAINEILNTHENHLYPSDVPILSSALLSLTRLKTDGFE